MHRAATLRPSAPAHQARFWNFCAITAHGISCLKCPAHQLCLTREYAID
ncbi:hypothetical protein LC55x_1050 [Lysobacter capsici]|nr:hypothetical protein LC55x_1050 [Lysobacter capsici]